MVDYSIGMRVQKARKFLRISQLEASERIGVFPNSMSRMESGKQIIKSHQMATFCKAFGVNPTWVLLGIGKMLLKDVVDLAEEKGSEKLIHLTIDSTKLEERMLKLESLVHQLYNSKNNNFD